jgi:hypothetical protein
MAVDYLEIAKRALQKYQQQEAEAALTPPRPFPHCPRCASYALYRPNNIGPYKCQTCGLIDITEEAARRVQ